jgi:hypothetical protein
MLTSLLYLSQTSDIATTGYDIADLQTQKQELEMQNEQLRLKVAQLESLDRVDHEASTRLHMGPPQREIYVTAVPISIPPPVATPSQPSSSASSRTIALVRWIARQVSALRGAIPGQ